MDRVNYQLGSGFLLSALGRKTELLWNKFLHEQSLTNAEFTALSVLASRGKCGQKQLAQDIEVDPRNIVATITKLQSRGWVEAWPSPQDGRAKILYITPKGQDMLQSWYAYLRPVDEAFFQNLTESERRHLQKLLIKLKYGND